VADSWAGCRRRGFCSVLPKALLELLALCAGRGGAGILAVAFGSAPEWTCRVAMVCMLLPSSVVEECG